MAMVLSALGLKELPTAEGKVVLSEEQKKLLGEAVEDPEFGSKFEKRANRELEAENKMLQAQESLKKLLADANISFEEAMDEGLNGDGDGDGGAEATSSGASLDPMIKAIRKAMAGDAAKIKALGDAAEQDNPEEILKAAKGLELEYSATHLFASGRDFDAFEGRPWNKRLKAHAEGKELKATNYSTVDISKINQDFEDYWADNKDEILNYVRAVDRLPSFWGTVSNVNDRIRYAQVLTGEVTQARKKKWLPKGDWTFQPVEGKVFPIQIDVEFSGSELQALETSWMARFVKQEGSSPFKVSFIGYLMMELLKKSYEENQIAMVKGVHVPTPDDATTPGKAIHTMRGLRKLISEAIIQRFYMPFDMGLPTDENIYEYVREFILSIPEYWRDLPNMKLYMSIDWRIKYFHKRELMKGLQPSFVPKKVTVDDFENIEIVPLHFMAGSNLFFCTTPDNIDKLENFKTEETQFEMQRFERNTKFLADYKKGIHVYAFGKQWAAGETMTPDYQMFFSNKVEDLLDIKVDQDPDLTVLSAKYHNVLKVGQNTQATAITNITDVPDDTYVYLYGNGGTAATIANGGNFDLASSMTLGNNTMILLRKRSSDGKLVEIYRNLDTSVKEYVELAADATTADADLGNKFVTQANTQATALTDIENAVDRQIYRIEGGSDDDATTIAKQGKFSRISSAIQLDDGVWIDVEYNESTDKFIEVGRSA